MRHNEFKETFKVTYWTNPERFCGQFERTVYIKARNLREAHSEAAWDHPEWAVLRVEQITDRFANDPCRDLHL